VFTKAGLKPRDTVIGYCHIGQQATAMLFAARTVGYPVLLYDGSFEDWLNRGLPLEIPPASAPTNDR
jgi:thiosulfate/3-mercaptopyruvate sulfurtransferase